MREILDWRRLAPEPEIHECDCEHCEMVGQPEEKVWPTLVPMIAGGVDYVTDRYLMIRSDLAPIPEGYEGPVLDCVTQPKRGFLDAPVMDVPATGLHFRRETLLAVKAMDFRLRLLDQPDAKLATAAVVTTDGEHVGWAVSRKVADDGWGNGSREYTEPGSTP